MNEWVVESGDDLRGSREIVEREVAEREVAEREVAEREVVEREEKQIAVSYLQTCHIYNRK